MKTICGGECVFILTLEQKAHPFKKKNEEKSHTHESALDLHSPHAV